MAFAVSQCLSVGNFRAFPQYSERCIYKEEGCKESEREHWSIVGVITAMSKVIVPAKSVGRKVAVAAGAVRTWHPAIKHSTAFSPSNYEP